MKNLFDFVIKGDSTTHRGKGKSLEEIEEEIKTLRCKYD
jgi:hypothetical protein